MIHFSCCTWNEGVAQPGFLGQGPEGKGKWLLWPYATGWLPLLARKLILLTVVTDTFENSDHSMCLFQGTLTYHKSIQLASLTFRGGFCLKHLDFALQIWKPYSEGWGDSSVGKIFSIKARRPESGIPGPKWKSKHTAIISELSGWSQDTWNSLARQPSKIREL